LDNHLSYVFHHHHHHHHMYLVDLQTARTMCIICSEMLHIFAVTLHKYLLQHLAAQYIQYF